VNAAHPVRTAARSTVTIARLGFGAAPVRGSLALIAELLGAGFTLASSYAIKFVVREAAAHHPAGALWAAAALALTGGAGAVAYLFYATLLPKMLELVSLRLDHELIRLTNRIPTLEYHDRPAFADKLALVRQSRQSLAGAVQVIGLSVRTVVMAVGAVAIMASIDLRFLVLPLFAIPRVIAGMRAQQLTKAAQDAYAEPLRLRAHVYGVIASAAAGKEIRVFGLQQPLADRFDQLTRQIRRQRDRANWGGAGWLMLGDAIFMGSYVAAIGWVVLRAARGEIGVGDVVLTATMAGALVGAIAMVVMLGQYLPTLMLTIERFHWLEDFVHAAPEAAAVAARPSAPPPRVLTRGIEVDAVSFAYPDCDTPALSDISLTLPAGGVIALVGENGSGKSTLVKLLCGFYRPTAGRILVDGEDLAGISIEAWRARVCAAFQDYANFEFQLHESVGVGDFARLGRRELATAALGRAGGAALAELEPAGLDTMLGRQWGGTELSGGQWQKLALARALIREQPLLVVFDEPTAALDAAAEHDMFSRFAAETRSAEAAGRVTVIVSHRFSTVRMADAIAVIDKGRLKEFGTHRALMAKDGLYAELFELQARAYR
jgi:ABC-type multidrug transport system fused ATPase/permease subunit